VKVIRRPRYACDACEAPIIQAPAPPRPIDGGMATEALIPTAAGSDSWGFPRRGGL
jgi:transposase